MDDQTKTPPAELLSDAAGLCLTCEGRGRVRFLDWECPTCQGTGTFAADEIAYAPPRRSPPFARSRVA